LLILRFLEPKAAASADVDRGEPAGKDNNRGAKAKRERHGEKHHGANANEAAGEGATRTKREFDRRSGTGRYVHVD
jgi:hypothetical protein